jgi:hypothetical protein
MKDGEIILANLPISYFQISHDVSHGGSLSYSIESGLRRIGQNEDVHLTCPGIMAVHTAKIGEIPYDDFLKLNHLVVILNRGCGKLQYQLILHCLFAPLGSPVALERW